MEPPFFLSLLAWDEAPLPGPAAGMRVVTVSLEQAKKVAPTMPHPRIPASPAVLKGAGPAIAAADRVRDAVKGHGRT
jgi:hypothetical protein